MQQDKATGAVSHNVANAAHETTAVVSVLDDVTHAANTTHGVADTVLAASRGGRYRRGRAAAAIKGFLQSVAV